MIIHMSNFALAIERFSASRKQDFSPSYLFHPDEETSDFASETARLASGA